MKIKYEFANGEVVEIEVLEDLGEVIVEIERLEYNCNQTERRRHSSYDAITDGGFQLADPKADVVQAVEDLFTNEELYKAVETLLPQQKELIHKVYFQELTLVEIAKGEGVTEAAIRNRLKKIYRRLEKDLK